MAPCPSPGWLVACLIVAALVGCAASPRRALPSGPSAGPPPAPVNIIMDRSDLPPDTPRLDVVDHLHGHTVADPYRWLEAADDARVRAWVDAQNEYGRRHLDAIASRPHLVARLKELLAVGRVATPAVRRLPGGRLRLLYTRRAGDDDQPRLLYRDVDEGGPLEGDDRVAVDPNALSRDGTVALDWWYPSRDGQRLAYGLSQKGSEDSTLHVLDLTSGKELEAPISRTRHASVAWKPDGSGYFYTRYPDPSSVPEGEARYHRTIYEHRVGRPASEDPVVFGPGQPMTDFHSCSLSPNGRWLVVASYAGWSESRVYLADTTQRPLSFVEITQGSAAATYAPIVTNERLYLLTNAGAPRYRLTGAPPSEWLIASVDERRRRLTASVIEEHHDDTLDDVAVIGGKLFARYLSRASTRLERFGSDGASLGAIALPGLGSSGGFSGLHDGVDAFYDYESFGTPVRIQRFSLQTKQSDAFLAAGAGTTALPQLDVRQLHAKSADGTRIPYFMVRLAAAPAGPAPTLLYGYGGFNVSLEPRFLTTVLPFVEAGGTYVSANLRGGGEFGEAWHEAGKGHAKQNVFDDVIAVAEDLVARNATRPERLAISGRSNGGLLVAAAITQRPDLFRAAICGVPLTDMVRYDRFLIGKLWVPEYGDPTQPEDLGPLLAYSPYHRVRGGTAYPATLVTTALQDTRVHPAHAWKFAAALQHATSSGRPVLLRTETEAGHGAGKPMSLVAEDHGDVLAFLFEHLAMTRPGEPPARPVNSSGDLDENR